MRKTIYTLAILSSIFVSCNGDLKDDIDDLEASLSETQANLSETEAENEALQIELDELSESINNTAVSEFLELTDSFIIAYEYTTSGSDTVTGENEIYGLDNNYTSAYSYNGEVYDIYIEFESPNKEALFSFNYNITTEEVETNNRLLKFYDDNIFVYFYDGDSNNKESEITVNSFNLETGEISIEFTFEFEDYYYSRINDYMTGELTGSFEGTISNIVDNS